MAELLPHITIDENKVITVPDELRRIAVQYEHKVRTVTFDCPRYWDDGRIDLKELVIYAAFERSDKASKEKACKNIRVDEEYDDMIHFDWEVTREATLCNGTLSLMICARKTEDGTLQNAWHTEINEEMIVSRGLKCENGEAEEIPEDKETEILEQVKELIEQSQPFVIKGTWSNDVLTSQSEDYFKFNTETTYAEIQAAINQDKIPLLKTNGFVPQYVPVHELNVDGDSITFRTNWEFGGVETVTEVVIYNPEGNYPTYENGITFYNAVDEELKKGSNRPVRNSVVTAKFADIETALGSYITDIAELVGGDA